MKTRLRQFIQHAIIILAVLTFALWIFSLFSGQELAVGNLVLRSQDGTTYPLRSPRPAAVAATAPLRGERTLLEDSPRNAVIVIGDGMGIGHISAGCALLNSPGSTLVMTGTPFIGLMSSWATDNLVPDSAATSTALATGCKVRKKAVGILDDGRLPRNLFEAAKARGLATGIVTTSGLVDATPAAFTSHVSNREKYDEIFEQMLVSGTDVLIGGDWTGYSKVRRNRRYLELLGRAEELAAGHGYSTVSDPVLLAGVQPPLLAIFPHRLESKLQHGPPLAATARRALELLTRAPGGFLLLVESEVVDETAHDNDVAGTVKGMGELDDAVSIILEESRQRGDTLVVILADHDTGGLGLVDGEFKDGYALVRWNYHHHIANLVPIFAFGPGAEAFTGVFDNTDFATRMAQVMDFDPLPLVTESVLN